MGSPPPRTINYYYYYYNYFYYFYYYYYYYFYYFYYFYYYYYCYYSPTLIIEATYVESLSGVFFVCTSPKMQPECVLAE